MFTTVSRTSVLTALCLLPALPKIFPLLQNVTDHVGERLELTCNVTADPTAQITWTKNSLQIPPHVKLRDDNATLIIESSTIEDDGIYICTAVNRQGRGVSSAKITIEGKASNCEFTLKRSVWLLHHHFPCLLSHIERHRVNIQKPLIRKLAKDTTNVTIDCYAYGKPLPSVVWKKDGKEIKSVPGFNRSAYGGEVVQVLQRSGPSEWNVTSRLYLRTAGIGYGEAGNYTCEAFNGVGPNTPDQQSVEVLCTLSRLMLSCRSLPPCPIPTPCDSL